jgi:hypothetical protein
MIEFLIIILLSRFDYTSPLDTYIVSFAWKISHDWTFRFFMLIIILRRVCDEVELVQI